MTDTSTVEPDTAAPVGNVSEGDHDRMAHIVYPKEKILEASVTGIPCEALCGKLWTPNADPDRFGVCPLCVETFERVLGRPWPGRR